MGRITFELQVFKEHNDHVEWWKKTWGMMKKKLRPDHIIVRWDFIGKLLSDNTLKSKILTQSTTQKIMFMKIPMPWHPATLEKGKPPY
jgi:hypothetical protein